MGVRRNYVNKLKFDPSEHGVIRRKKNPVTNLWEEDPEIDPDAEFPDVHEGIVYKAVSYTHLTLPTKRIV